MLFVLFCFVLVIGKYYALVTKYMFIKINGFLATILELLFETYIATFWKTAAFSVPSPFFLSSDNCIYLYLPCDLLSCFISSAELNPKY